MGLIYVVGVAGHSRFSFSAVKKTKKVAAEIPFEYDGYKLNVESTDAFWSAVKNSYDQLKPGLDHSINLESVLK